MFRYCLFHSVKDAVVTSTVCTMFNSEEYYTVIVPAGTVLGSLMCHSLNIQMRRQEEGKPSLKNGPVCEPFPNC